MALTDDGNGMGTVMPVAPMYGGNVGGFGDFGGGWWLILLLLIFGGGNWGNGIGGNGMYPWMNQQNAMASGFDHAANQAAMSSLQSAVTSGFGDVQTALCGGFAGVNAGVANGFAQAEIAENARQMANMQQLFGMQTAMAQGQNTLAGQLAQCCCKQDANAADVKYTIATENCADRAALSEGIRDIIANQTAGTQRILDTLCQDKIDAKNEKIAELQNKLNMANFQASQVAQDNYLQNALTAQTQYFLSLYPRTAEAA